MGMGKFLIRRILAAIPVLLLIVFVSFVVIRVTPGGPFDSIGEGRRVPQSVIDGLNRQYGLDQPLLEQFIHYVGSLVRLDFGPSLGRATQGEPVTDIIARGLPVSMQVGLFSVILGFSLGIPLGVDNLNLELVRHEFSIVRWKGWFAGAAGSGAAVRPRYSQS